VDSGSVASNGMRERKTRASADERRGAYNFCVVVAVESSVDGIGTCSCFVLHQ
jgi:hypothetical protein